MADGDTLLPGFRFCPTDEELVAYYLRRKAFRGLSHDHVIAELDLYNFEPSDLPGLAVLKSRDGQWFFFAPRERRRRPGTSRNSRATKSGYWKTTGKDRKIPHGSEEVAMGMKKSLVYYQGRAPHGARTDWVMHEYRISEDYEKARSLPSAFVVCKVFKKGGPGPRNGEQLYGAHVREDVEIEEAEERETSESSAMMIPSVSAPLLAAMKQEEEALLDFLMHPLQGGGVESSLPKNGGSRPRNREQYGSPAQEDSEIEEAEERENSESSVIMIPSISAPLSVTMNQEEEALLAFFMCPLSGSGLQPSSPKKSGPRPRKWDQFSTPSLEDGEIEEAEEQENSESSSRMIPPVSPMLLGAMIKQEEESLLALLMHPLSGGGLEPPLLDLNTSSDTCFTKDSVCSDLADELFADLPSLANNMLFVDQSGEEDAKILEEILQSAANDEDADCSYYFYHMDASIPMESNSNSFWIGSLNTKSMVKPTSQYSFHHPGISSSQVIVRLNYIRPSVQFLLAPSFWRRLSSVAGEPSCHSSETVLELSTISRANSQNCASVNEGSFSSNFPCSGVSTQANDVCRQILALASEA